MLFTIRRKKSGKEFSSIEIPIPFTITYPKGTSTKVSAYDIEDPHNLLATIIEKGIPAIEREIPSTATTAQDQQSFENIVRIFNSLREQGGNLLDIAKRARKALVSTTPWDALTIAKNTGELNATFDQTLESFNSEADQHSLKSVPQILGPKSYLLAVLFHQYLRMSQNAYVLNEPRTALEELPGVFAYLNLGTSEALGKKNFKIDSDARRRKVTEKSEALSRQLEEKKEQFASDFEPEIAQDVSISQESLDALKNIIDRILAHAEKRYHLYLKKHEILTKKIELLNFIEAFLNEHPNASFEALEDEVNGFVRFRDRTSFSGNDDPFLIDSNEPSDDFTLTNYWNEIKPKITKSPSVLYGFVDFFSTPSETPLQNVERDLRTKIQDEKKSIQKEIEELNMALKKQSLLIKELIKIKDKLSWYLIGKKDKLNELSILIKNLESAIGSDEFNLNDRLNEIKKILGKKRHEGKFYNQTKKDSRELTNFEKFEKILKDNAQVEATWKKESEKKKSTLFSSSLFSFSSRKTNSSVVSATTTMRRKH